MGIVKKAPLGCRPDETWQADIRCELMEKGTGRSMRKTYVKKDHMKKEKENGFGKCKGFVPE